MLIYGSMLIRKQFSISLNRNEEFMPGTRTAPTFTTVPGVTAATRRIVTFHMIDASGDLYPVAIDVAVNGAAGDIEGLAASYQACSNASMYAITEELQTNGVALASNAVSAYRASVETGINLLFKRASDGDTLSMRVIAPVAETLDGSRDIPMPFDTPLDDLITDHGTLRAAWPFNSAQFTGRRERRNNPKVKA